jgi:hypothetical protein
MEKTPVEVLKNSAEWSQKDGDKVVECLGLAV